MNTPNICDNRILAIDVGAGTQDILVYDEHRSMENCFKLVMPAPTVVLAQRVRQATRDGQPIHLCGNLMGGGAISGALRDHLQHGHPVYAEPLAAQTLYDDLERVRAMGVTLEAPPTGMAAVRIELHDVDLMALRQALGAFGVPLPSRYAIAVQDHGDRPGIGQRRLRFETWERFIASGGRLDQLIQEHPAPHLTRMHAIQRDLPNALVMDTAGSAIWGALEDNRIAAQRQHGVVIVNVGNGHTLGALVQNERVWGLFEHHTQCMTKSKLQTYVEALVRGDLDNERVYEDGGHGCCIAPNYWRGQGYSLVAVTGPNWELADGLGFHQAVPHGDMMLAGCFGLVRAAHTIWSM